MTYIRWMLHFQLNLQKDKLCSFPLHIFFVTCSVLRKISASFRALRNVFCRLIFSMCKIKNHSCVIFPHFLRVNPPPARFVSLGLTESFFFSSVCQKFNAEVIKCGNTTNFFFFCMLLQGSGSQ